MAVIWLILKIILWIVLGLLGLLLVLTILPVTVDVKYSKEKGFSLVARVLMFWYTVLPQKDKNEIAKRKNKKKSEVHKEELFTVKSPEKTEPIKESTATHEAKEQKLDTEKNAGKASGKADAKEKAATAPQKNTKQKPTWEMLSQVLQQAKELAAIAGKAIRFLLKGIWIHSIQIRLPVHGADAAKTAIQTGRIHGAAGTGFGILNNLLHLSFKQYEIEPDYTGDRQKEAFFSCKITSCLLIMIIVVIWALPKVMKSLKKKRIHAGNKTPGGDIYGRATD